jgi:hypothetical protein
MAATAAQEQRLVQVYNDGVDMRKKYGGTATAAPKFPDKATTDKYNALIAEYKKLEAVVGVARAKVLREPKHVAAYGISNLSTKAKAGIGIGAIVALLAIAGGVYFVMMKKGSKGGMKPAVA